MIILAIVLACMAAVILILNLLPVWTPIDLAAAVAEFTTGAGNGFFDGLAWMNHYIPVQTMLTLLGLQITIWTTVRIVQFVVWLLQLFHVAGGGD